MAQSYYNTTLEYATNTLEFWNVDDLGAAMPFATDTLFAIARSNDVTITQTWVKDASSNAAGGYLKFIVNPSKIILKAAGDTTNDLDNPAYNHTYSLRSPTTSVYMTGNLNMIEVA